MEVSAAPQKPRQHLACSQQKRGFAQQAYGHDSAARYYSLLDIDRNADEKALKAAYKKQAMEHHPDRGGDEATFKEISKAYEVLSDPEKRQLYDTYGEEGLDNMDQGGGGGAAPDPFDMFSQIFGFNAGGARRGPRGRPVTKDQAYELGLTLEELYGGAQREVTFNRDALCGTCDGKGGKNVQQCGRCKGTGVTVTLQQLGIMVQQIQSPCGACGGKGFTIPRESVCKDCNGKTTVRQKKPFSIDVERGTKDGREFRFRGQADEKPGHDTGDVVIVVRQEPHKTFQRVADNLVMTKTITLSEALCGFQFTTPFLDGKDLVIRSKQGQVVKPGDWMLIEEKGMPRPHGQPPADLLLRLEVQFPNTLPADEQEKLLDILGGKAVPKEVPPNTPNVKHLTTRQVEELNRRLQDNARQQEARRQGGQGAQCQQQ